MRTATPSLGGGLWAFDNLGEGKENYRGYRPFRHRHPRHRIPATACTSPATAHLAAKAVGSTINTTNGKQGS
jgi:hypothetical protein